MCYRPYYCCLWIYYSFLDYYRFSASVCAFSDAVQDRWNSHMLPTPAATMPPTTAAATPAAPAVSGKFQCCQYGRRISSLSYDHHSVCSLYRGFECT